LILRDKNSYRLAVFKNFNSTSKSKIDLFTIVINRITIFLTKTTMNQFLFAAFLALVSVNLVSADYSYDRVVRRQLQNVELRKGMGGGDKNNKPAKGGMAEKAGKVDNGGMGGMGGMNKVTPTTYAPSGSSFPSSAPSDMPSLPPQGAMGMGGMGGMGKNGVGGMGGMGGMNKNGRYLKGKDDEKLDKAAKGGMAEKGEKVAKGGMAEKTEKGADGGMAAVEKGKKL
jgi:hypothetical protein